MDQIPLERCKPLDREALGKTNRLIFDYWQSLRVKQALPSRTSFAPGAIKAALSRLILVHVWPGERAVCRLVGTDIVRIMRTDMTGVDIIERTAPEFQRERLARYANSLDGLVHRSIRTVNVGTGQQIAAEMLILPFADTREDGSRLAFLATDWKATDYDERLQSTWSAFREPDFAEYLTV